MADLGVRTSRKRKWILIGAVVVAALVVAVWLSARPMSFGDLRNSALTACESGARAQLPGAAVGPSRITETVRENPATMEATYRAAGTVNGRDWACFTNVYPGHASAAVTVSP